MEYYISPRKHDLSCLHFSPKINALTRLIYNVFRQDLNKRPIEFKNPVEKVTYSNHIPVEKTF